MKTFKAQLLAATVVAGSLPTVAQAQFAYPAAELRGAGGNAVQTVLVQTLNCNGNPGDHSVGNTDNLNPGGSGNGTVAAVPEGKFTQTSPSAKSPDFDCNIQEIQPNFQGKYIGIGSGTGRAWWRTFVNQLDGSPGLINPFGSWTNLDFAISPAPIAASDLAAYDAGANSPTNKAGTPIQFPLYVLPVAIAYNPVYARYQTGGGVIDLTLQVNPAYVTTDDNGNPTGGLRLSRNLYCQVFNGYVTNFNDKAFASTGKNKSLKDPNDPSSRWSSDGAPIRLVGRLDSAGTTDILSRHLAAACDGQAGVAINKFDKNSEALPFDSTSSIDLRAFRSDTRYYPGRPATDFAGTVQSLSGAVFIRASGGNPARIDTTQGSEQPGLFLVADGSSGVRDAINFQPDPTGGQTIVLNGKVGYIGADFVKPAPGAQLFSAALQINGTGKSYASPTTADALLAFGKTTLPPQTTSLSGKYDPSDTRTGPRRDGQPGDAPIDRANPLHWTSVLYSNPASNLATPKFGYPITGTAQILAYTCYADDATRASMVEFLSLYTGDVTKDSSGDPVSASLLTGTKSTARGLLAQLNIGPMPDAWLTAIHSTFLVKDTTTLGARNLWIQDKLPKKKLSEAKSNPNCTPGKGA